MLRRSLRRGELGLSVVELLVVLTIFGVISAIIAVTTTRGLQADSQARERITAFEDMQIGLERMSREVRAADPVISAQGDEIVVQVFRSGECLRYRYTLDGAVLRTQQWRSTDDCQTLTNLGEQVLFRGLEPTSDLFEYQDRQGNALSEPIAAGNIGTVRIRLIRPLVGDREAEVSTVVRLRNS
jgi:type II secretory pathway pseudopilin PulG